MGKLAGYTIAFQFLIVKIKTFYDDWTEAQYSMFQFLIVKIKTPKNVDVSMFSK